MADRRIRISKDKAEFVDLLASSKKGDGPFFYKVDVLAFAAAFGASRGVYIEVVESTKEPIRHDVFESHRYDTIINLLAVFREKHPRVLARTDEMENRRATIFEAYANGGLQVLLEEFKGARNYMESFLLLIQVEKERGEGIDDDFNLNQYVG